MHIFRPIYGLTTNHPFSRQTFPLMLAKLQTNIKCSLLSYDIKHKRLLLLSAKSGLSIIIQLTSTAHLYSLQAHLLTTSLLRGFVCGVSVRKNFRGNYSVNLRWIWQIVWKGGFVFFGKSDWFVNGKHAKQTCLIMLDNWNTSWFSKELLYFK